MSLLLVEGPVIKRWSGVANTLIDRLRAAGDQIRVLLADDGDASVVEGLRDQGVHVAFGDSANGDLMERAAQGCRSIVLFEPNETLRDKAVEAARFARVERLIACAREGRGAEAPEKSAVASYVWLRGRPKGIVRPGLSWEAYASAVDAADDLAGDVKLDLDLTMAAAWQALGLKAPGT